MADFVPAARFKVADTDEPFEAGYQQWKNDKIEKALQETKDRAKMIPADEVWKRLGFED